MFGKSLVNNYATIYAFGTHLYKVRQLVQNDMDNYTAQVSAPADTCIAYANVQKLATKCTVANMQALLDAQVAIPSQTVSNAATVLNGQTVLVAPPAAAALAFRTVRPVQPALQSSPPLGSTVVPLR